MPPASEDSPTATSRGSSRDRLLEEAARLIAASPGQDVSLRAICDAAGVKVPTLYHFFGSKAGLLDAVIEHGFDLYAGTKAQQSASADPVQDLREGWDTHVAFGLANPGFYALMYGQVVPGHRPEAQQRPTALLRRLVQRISEQGRLAVEPDLATDLVLAANIGVTLHQIVRDRPDPDLSAATREATIRAVTRGGEDDRPTEVDAAATALLDALGPGSDRLGDPELVLLRKWLGSLRD